MTVHAARAHTRRRTTAALSGLAALALVLGACGEEGTAEDAVGSATSAVGSAAAQATSAVGDATRGDGTSGSETTAPGQEGQGEDEGEGGGNPDQEFLGDIRAIGVNVEDEQDYLTRGRNACASLDGGTGYMDVLGQYNSAHPEAPVTEAPIIVAAAVKSFCSQHLPQLGQEGGGEGN